MDLSRITPELLKTLSVVQLQQLSEKVSKEVVVDDLRQKVIKIRANSLFGVMGSRYFRFYNIENFEAVTLTGQYIIRYIANEINKFVNEYLGTTDVRYVIYCDTDSVYVKLDAVVERINKIAQTRGIVLSKQKIIDAIDAFCKSKVDVLIEKAFAEMTTYLNGYQNTIAMKREAIAETGVWSAKKRYVMNVWDLEGVRYETPEMKYTGIELAKASSPKLSRDIQYKAIQLLLEGEQEKLWAHLEKSEEDFANLTPEEISFPRSVNGIIEYGDPKTIFKKRTPIQTKAALIHNWLVDKKGLRIPKIKDGDKIRFVKLRDNPITPANVIAFTRFLPKEFNIESFIDYDVQFQDTVIEPLKLLLEPTGWTTKKRATLGWE